ncbi:C-type lectin domain family 4 member M-like [Erpetoichthys calabaricus]|uniref:C-type lectin domain family 4 member M-like n=1 Tax=Erpetoichthys calabaricus TaxID=27687 RepID=UPI0022347483|nr:C-type lectin domain family 4 member M-like [Erpetoichthys calabaricus]
MMTEIYRVSEKHADNLCTIEESPHVSGADGDTAPVPQVRAEKKVNLQMVLLIFSLLLVAAPIFFSIYYFIKLNHKEQELEELRIANYNLTSNNSALQSQYTTLNKKHEELAKEFSKLQEYYCDGTNTSHENTCILCKLDWIPFGSKCYFISTKTLIWSDSHDWCLTKGGQLVNIESLKEWEFLNTQSEIIGGDLKFFWIGHNYIIKEDNITRMDGEPLKSKRDMWQASFSYEDVALF